MTLHYALKKLDSTVVSQYFDGIQLPADYLKLFQEGNLFSVGKWRFYLVQDKDNFKKTALHFKAMNARSEQKDYWEITTDRDAYSLGYKKNNSCHRFIYPFRAMAHKKYKGKNRTYKQWRWRGFLKKNIFSTYRVLMIKG
ncbi:hypothetical protein [Staphylococcus americanisciuri]|uniref:Uncharacterized protein n=1 Tax=Staphylococcus americanisciuri TaxID=2973940 RepID=A0ABT2F0S7_9STAP|nr:hypothetical protein [Staphylococcus americanisciuri]MCS4485942.1 hypothetical protein [Staphylococcus americanisciuri]